MLLMCAGWLASGAANAAANAAAPGSAVLDAARARVQDAETMQALSDEGRQLYARERIKLTGAQYCGQAVALAERGEFRLSIQAASKALIIGQQQADASLVAASQRDLAIAYSYAGDLLHAAQYARAALDSGGAAAPVIAGPALKTLGDVAVREARPVDAIAFYQQADAAASATFRPLVRLALANARVRAGQLDAARAMFAQLGMPDDALALPVRRGLANLRLAEGDQRGALAQFTAIVATAGGADAAYQRLWGLEGQGRVLALMGDAAGARAAYLKAVAAAEGIRARFRSEEFKSGLFGDVQQVFERAIALSMAAGDAAGALALSEQSRARALLDVVRGRAGRDPGAVAFTPAQLTAAVQEQEAIVVFHALDDAVLAWVVRPGAIEGVRIARSRTALAQDVEALRDAILDRRPAARALGTALYATLLAPLHLAPGERLLIVPHDALHYLPFQALRGPGGYLVEDHALAFAPSASVALQLARRDTARNTPLAAFGNPGLDTRLALPGAEREAGQIAALFAGASLYLQAAATRAQFRASAATAGILHVAAHAEVDLVDPLQSRILLASQGDDAGFLEAREIYGLSMDKVALVTLSACESGLGRIARGDEILGFTRSFLSAGAASLLVSLWPVEDASTELLMTTLYGALARGVPAAQAMQQAQLTVLRHSGYAEPYFWAAFDLVGDWRMQLASGGAGNARTVP